MNVTILTMVLAAAVGQSAETSTKRSTRIYVRTTPPGASIVLDGKELGTSDGLFLVPPGVRKITLEMEGYNPEEKSVDVGEGWVTRVEVQMKRSGKRLFGREEAADTGEPVSSGVLEFRIAANQEEAETFAKTGKDLAWYASLMNEEGGLVVRKEGDRNEVLLWETPEKSMTASPSDEKEWRIIEVSIMAEPDRATRIGVVFDHEGGRRLRKLTGANIGRQVAMLVDGRVVSCPRLQAAVGPRVEITGNFTKAELNRIATALQSGMEIEARSLPEVPPK